MTPYRLPFRQNKHWGHAINTLRSIPTIFGILFMEKTNMHIVIHSLTAQRNLPASFIKIHLTASMSSGTTNQEDVDFDSIGPKAAFGKKTKRHTEHHRPLIQNRVPWKYLSPRKL
jgi:hypothetical protein